MKLSCYCLRSVVTLQVGKFSTMKEERFYFGKRFSFFIRNSGVHGLKYIAQERRPFFRSFWLIILLVCIGCFYLLLLSVVECGAEVTYTPDTRYLYWRTTFPAVTVCEKANPILTQRKFTEKYPNFLLCFAIFTLAELMDPLNYDFRRYISELVFARGTCNNKMMCGPCGTQVPCDVPWRDIVDNIHKTCSEMVSSCTINDKVFSCCSKFHSVDSEHGPCFTFNTLQTKESTHENLFTVNRSTGLGILSFQLLSDAEISIHSIEELSTKKLDTKFKFNVKTSEVNDVEYLFSIIEMENDPRLQFESIYVRRCRYLHEIPTGPLHTYRVYSYGACTLARSTEHSYKQCGCIHPVRDRSYQDKYCNYTGLNCLVNYEVQKSKLGNADPDIDQDCLPSCIESELSTIHISRKWVPSHNGKGTTVKIRMLSLPTLRYQRNLLRTNLDLVVSIGGMLGLFFSASILSLAEIIYLILRKPNF